MSDRAVPLVAGTVTARALVTDPRAALRTWLADLAERDEPAYDAWVDSQVPPFMDDPLEWSD